MANQYELEVGVPVEVGRASGHFWFSTLHPIEGRDVLCEVVTSADTAQGEWPAVLYLSRDAGASWTKALTTDCYGAHSVRIGARRLLLMPYETWPASPGNRRSAAADGTIITCGQDGSVTAERSPVRFLDFPRDLEEYYRGEFRLLTNGNILPLSDGTLFTTLYGRFVGDEKESCFAVTSDDGGFTWRFLSVAASYQDVPDATEGPDESNTVVLPDGRLMCVYRVGSGTDQRYHKSYSADDGTTWTKPEKIENAWSVEPQLVRLDSGAILLSGGREGLFLWLCTDGAGDHWEPFNLAEHHNAALPDATMHYSSAFCEAKGIEPAQSTSYTGMIHIGGNEALICYDRLANGWEPAPGPWGDESAVFCARIRIVPKAAEE